MTPRRQQTSLRPSQPVRVYKVIALSFLCLTLIVLGIIIFMSAKRAVITIETRPEPVDVSGTVEISSDNAPGSFFGIVTSTRVTLRQVYTPQGGQEEDALAGGTVILHNDGDTAQTLIPKTRLLSSDGILFRLKERTSIDAFGTTEAAVYADQSGKSGNIGPTRFTIPGLSLEKQKTIYAESLEPMMGGTINVGVWTDGDMTRATEDMRTRLVTQAKGQFGDLFDEKNSLVALSDETVAADIPPGSKAGEVPVDGKAVAILVTYPGEEVKQTATELLVKRIVDDTESIVPSSVGPTISIDDYDLGKGEATLKIFYNGLASLNPESRVVDKAVFFGKTKEEVRRYVLSLDHVRGVDIRFTPRWMLRVPRISDHVSVIVKSVQ